MTNDETLFVQVENHLKLEGDFVFETHFGQLMFVTIAVDNGRILLMLNDESKMKLQ